jgi:hypothetical protein
MSFEPDFIPYPSSQGTNTMGPDLFFAPDPQLAFAPSPESFDREVDNEEFDLELSFKEFDVFFATFGDTISVAPTPSAVTDSTESVYTSQCSCDLTPSDYSIPSEIEFRGSVYDGLYSTRVRLLCGILRSPAIHSASQSSSQRRRCARICLPLFTCSRGPGRGG